MEGPCLRHWQDTQRACLKPEAIPPGAQELLSVDVQWRDLQLSDKRLFVRRYCYSAMNKVRAERRTWVGNVYTSLRGGYTKAAEFLLKNLPLNNPIITSMSALTPSLTQDASVATDFITLSKALPDVVQPEEMRT